MRKLLPVVMFGFVLLSSCKKEEQKPAPVVWNEDWACFTATLIASWDTTEVGFSSNQNAFCYGNCATLISLIPNESEARYFSSISNQYYQVEVKRGVLNFTGANWDDVPEDTAFINYFRPGYYTLTNDFDYLPGFEIIFHDVDGNIYSSGDYHNQGNSNYTCKIFDYHPFMRNGVQYVKVKMVFDGIYVANQSGDGFILSNAQYEGYFVND